MSPVVRKWGTRAVVWILCLSTSLTSIVLVETVFAQSAVTDIVSPESWLAWTERYGMPLVVLMLLGMFGVKAISAVWQFFKPIFQRYADAGLSLIEKQSQFIEKMDQRQDNIEKLMGAEHSGHLKTQEILAEIDRKTGEIHKDVRHIDSKLRNPKP